ncbi:uncharacterized protein LOC119397183 [Rhipicephalus sanguineus]|uniref:uncharacterized protein LOC119397183 n=1 Tax=Rhipicephalus sanguineus TaxID=34632 RepID=UPI001894EBA9|nr:uncharacterized protein LOC119397183 [Rhipicephalus sanguineus]
MGDKAEDALTALCLTAVNAKKYVKVIEAFDSHFVVKKNIIYERALFNRRIQDEGEPMTDFITSLYTLAERCDYGDFKDELIHDRIVVGVRDQKLSTKLQLEQDLTLEKAVLCVKQFEVLKQQPHIHVAGSPEGTAAIDRLHTASQPRRVDSKRKPVGQSQTRRSYDWQVSGKSELPGGNQKRWTDPVENAVVRQHVNGQEVQFRLDTGADVSALPEDTYLNLSSSAPLRESDKFLIGPSNEQLDVLGMIEATVVYKGATTSERFYVARNLGEPLLRPHRDRLKPNAVPFAITSTRRIPIPLHDAVEAELKKLENQGVITKVQDPSPWCAPIVVTPKKDGGVRLCVDYTMLNKGVLREHHPIPSVEHTLGLLGGAKYFSKLDAYSGLYQIKVDPKSSELTTFITPFGRYKFNRMPFGISSAPEHYQRMISHVLEGLKGVVCHIDDVLVWGETKQSHDERLALVLERLLKADEGMVEAIVKMKPPTNVTEIKRFLGMTNFVSRFIPNFGYIAHPLTELLRKSNHFVWDAAQQQAFQEIKEAITSRPVLALYDPRKRLIVSSDASSYGLGAVLFQKDPHGNRRPVAYASKTLTSAEAGYSQIEKEALGITWACEKFRDYFIGLHFKIETDHKPLVPILSTKPIDSLTPRLQRLRLRMMRYDYETTFIPGKQLITADALSRQPLATQDSGDISGEVSTYASVVVGLLSSEVASLEKVAMAQKRDPTCKAIEAFTRNGWPAHKSKTPKDCQYLAYTYLQPKSRVLELGPRASELVQLRLDN